MRRQNGRAETDATETFIDARHRQNGCHTGRGAVVHYFDDLVLVQRRTESCGDRIDHYRIDAEVSL